MHNEALLLSLDGIPSIFSIISLLENEYEIKTYLEEDKEQFLHQYEALCPKKQKEEKEEELASHYKLGSTSKRNRDISYEQIIEEDNLIEISFMDKQKNPNYIKMQKIRKKLPAWLKTSEILEIIRENQIVIISGETGCGKSTQVHCSVF